MFNIDHKNTTANEAARQVAVATVTLRALTEGFTKTFDQLSPAGQVVAVSKSAIYNTSTGVLKDLGLHGMVKSLNNLDSKAALFVAKTIGITNSMVDSPEISEQLFNAFDTIDTDMDAVEEVARGVEKYVAEKTTGYTPSPHIAEVPANTTETAAAA